MKGKGGKGKENGEGRKRMPGQGRKCVGGGKGEVRDAKKRGSWGQIGLKGRGDVGRKKVRNEGKGWSKKNKRIERRKVKLE